MKNLLMGVHNNLSICLSDDIAKLSSIKLASPRWAKLFESLSDTAKSRIIKSLPSTVTKSISRTPLGGGAEGAVFKTLTGKEGPTATKVFFDSPMLKGDTTGLISGGARNLKPTLGGMMPSERAEVLSKFPEIFPKIHATNPRGYTMEMLEDIGKDDSILSSLKYLFSDTPGLISLKRSLRSNSSGKGQIPSFFSGMEATVDKPMVLKGNHPILDFGWRDGQVKNMMRAKDGRIVISDPIILKGK